MMRPNVPQQISQFDDDSEALHAVNRWGGALCTVVEIEGTWSRRLGAQLAVLPDGTTYGSLADGCLEKALAHEASMPERARVLRYGSGSPFIDIRLPCGSGISVHVDPSPNRASLSSAVQQLSLRKVAHLPILPGFKRSYLPRLRLVVCGSGPEVRALSRLAAAQGVEIVTATPSGEPGDFHLSLGQSPNIAVDPWTAIIVLFHDHEWERSILPWALSQNALYVGAQGGQGVRKQRGTWLSAEAVERLRSPIGMFAHARTPTVLALSILAEAVSEYEKLL